MQTAGRGRRGRAWVSEPGNFYGSLLLTDPGPPERAPQLSFVASLAVHDAVNSLVPLLGARLRVKWPNDVLCDGEKLAGIMIEGAGTRPLAVVLGIGINCRHHPEGTEFPATDLAAKGGAASAEDVFGALSATMFERLRQWSEGRGFASIRADWLSRATGLGEPVRVRTGQRELTGRLQTVDESGHLVVQLADGKLEAIASGEVFPMTSIAG